MNGLISILGQFSTDLPEYKRELGNLKNEIFLDYLLELRW